jgi:hypothetical protein
LEEKERDEKCDVPVLLHFLSPKVRAWRGFLWEDGGDAGAAFEFLVDAFEGVGGAQAALVSGGEGEDGESSGTR